MPAECQLLLHTCMRLRCVLSNILLAVFGHRKSYSSCCIPCYLLTLCVDSSWFDGCSQACQSAPFVLCSRWWPAMQLDLVQRHRICSTQLQPGSDADCVGLGMSSMPQTARERCSGDVTAPGRGNSTYSGQRPAAASPRAALSCGVSSSCRRTVALDPTPQLSLAAVLAAVALTIRRLQYGWLFVLRITESVRLKSVWQHLEAAADEHVTARQALLQESHRAQPLPKGDATLHHPPFEDLEQRCMAARQVRSSRKERCTEAWPGTRVCRKRTR